ncbi:hypothetical protein [Leifsonia sp. P73]|uniref:hypothetical protein n=1 Tax=Leifsonia sp. P73 TaxID=3423959 RepID=UPI003DA4CE8F
MGTTSDLFDGTATRLSAANVGQYIPRSDTTTDYASGAAAITRSKLPTAPDSAIALRFMPALADVSSPFSTFLMQALVRGLPNDAESASDLTDEVRDNLLGLTDVWFGSTHVVQVRFAGQVDLDPDESERDQWSLKLLWDVDEPPTDLRPAGGWD